VSMYLLFENSHELFLESFTDCRSSQRGNSCLHEDKCGVAAAGSQLATVQTAFAIRFLAEFE